MESAVSNATIICICITLAITLIGPIAVFIIYGIKNKGKGVWLAGLIGAAGFFVPQVIIRLPILNALAASKSAVSFAENNYILYCFILAFTAALFELAGRYTAAKLLRKNQSFERAFAAGLGHGGIEAIILIGMIYINNLIYSLMINMNAFDELIEQVKATGVDVNQLYALKEALISTPSGTFLLAGYERILTVIAHIAMSIIVFYFVSRKEDIRGILICLGAHTCLDFVSGVTSGLSTKYLGSVVSQNVSYIITYTFITLFAAAAVVVIIKLKKLWKPAEIITERE